MTQGNPPNQAQAALWNDVGGRTWADLHATLDQMFQPLQTALVDAALAGAAERVLDVGCGAGATTLAVARALGPKGQCTGMDISAPLIATATARAAAEGASSVTFIRGDAQTHAFQAGAFDTIMSRMGVMFFDDPEAAFANLQRAARPGGRLAFIAWRSRDENPFMMAAERAAASVLADLPKGDDGGPGQFAFASASRVGGILEAGGWTSIDIRPVDFALGMPAAMLRAYVTRLGLYGRIRGTLDDKMRATADAAVLAAFDPYVEGDRVQFTAACWMVTALA